MGATLVCLVGLNVWFGVLRPDRVVLEIRLSRGVLGAAIGAALGAAGAMMQVATRNALASPSLTGVSAGAAAGGLLVLAIGEPSIPGPAAALIGGCLAGGATALLSGLGRGGPVRLALAGAGISAIALSMSMALLVLSDPARVQAGVHRWIIGTLSGTLPSDLLSCLPWLAAGAAVSAVGLPHVRVLGASSTLARSVGAPVTRARLALLSGSVLLVVASVSVSGPIGFVGLIASHLARRIRRRPEADPGWVGLSAVVGACILCAADLLARTLLGTRELPVGALTGLLGAPALLVIISRTTLAAGGSATAGAR